MKQFLNIYNTEELLVIEALVELGFEPCEHGYEHPGKGLLVSPDEAKTFDRACRMAGAMFFDRRSSARPLEFRMHYLQLSQDLLAKAIEKEDQFAAKKPQKTTKTPV